MTNTAVTTDPISASARYLPGRTVELANYPYGNAGRGIVIAVSTSGNLCTVKFGRGPLRVSDFRDLRADELVAVHRDREPLAYDELIASTLGERLAARAGGKALSGFHRGWNEGRIGFTEAARDLLRDVDARLLDAKHTRCTMTHVESPAGDQRPGRDDYQQGDRLVSCAFYVDGPGTPFCGVHRPLVEADRMRPSIFHAGITEAEQDAARARGELIDRAPIAVIGRSGEAEVRVMTKVEVRRVELAGMVDLIRDVLITEKHAVIRLGDEYTATDLRRLRHLIEGRMRREPIVFNFFDLQNALAYGLRRGLVDFHEGPRYSAPTIRFDDKANF